MKGVFNPEQLFFFSVSDLYAKSTRMERENECKISPDTE